MITATELVKSVFKFWCLSDIVDKMDLNHIVYVSLKYFLILYVSSYKLFQANSKTEDGNIPSLPHLQQPLPLSCTLNIQSWQWMMNQPPQTVARGIRLDQNDAGNPTTNMLAHRGFLPRGLGVYTQEVSISAGIYHHHWREQS